MTPERVEQICNEAVKEKTEQYYDKKEGKKAILCLKAAKYVLKRIIDFDNDIIGDKYFLKDISNIYTFISLGKTFNRIMIGCSCNQDDGFGLSSYNNVISKKLVITLEGINTSIECITEMLAYVKVIENELFERLDNSISHLGLRYIVNSINAEIKRIKKQYNVDKNECYLNKSELRYIDCLI